MTLKEFMSVAASQEQAAPIVAKIQAVNRLLAKQADKGDWPAAVYVALNSAELAAIFQDGLQKKLASLTAELAAIPVATETVETSSAPVQSDLHFVPPHGLPRVRLCPECHGDCLGRIRSDGRCEICDGTGMVRLGTKESAVAGLQLIQSEIFAWARTNFGVTTVVANQPVVLNMISFLGNLCHSVLKSSQGIRGTPEAHAVAAQQAANTLARAAMIFRERSGMKTDDTSGPIVVRNLQLAAFFGMMEELGEMAGALLSDLDAPVNGDNDRGRDVRDGVGDLQVYLLDFCASNGLNAEECLNTTWAKVSQRDWKKDKLKGGETSDG